MTARGATQLNSGRLGGIARTKEASKVATWHENDDLWEMIAPFIFGENRWAVAPDESEAIISWLEVKPGAKILDLGCGPGRHSLELARRGFEVTGIVLIG
jgi:2-polyprenyl-3-methyl-5-hydroxy-6-metoxy-1,4-benzoquinol methylase